MDESYVMDQTAVKVALALGGGGVRGLAHIGVIKSLLKYIPVHMIAGTSMGAIVGALYALETDIGIVETKIKEVFQRRELKNIEEIISQDSPVEEKKVIIKNLLSFVKQFYLMNLRAVKRWIFSGKEIAEIFDFFGFDCDFENVKLPFVCTSVDLRTGEEVILDSGNIKEAVLASAALPAVFPPVKKDERLLVDGGVVGSVPVSAARKMEADLVIAVGVEAQVDYNKKLGNGMDILFQADAIRAYKLSELCLKGADIVIYPDVGTISWASFSRADECIAAGEKAAEEAKPRILELIRKKRREKFWKEFFSLPKYGEGVPRPKTEG